MAAAALIAAILFSVGLLLAIRHHGSRDKIVCRKADQIVRDHFDHR